MVETLPSASSRGGALRVFSRCLQLPDELAVDVASIVAEYDLFAGGFEHEANSSALR
jgi:hypothetical protein